ncbi:MAG: hypothetical protein HUU21_21150 [Polyangiaceae bacterium]|nr:hypothetical protein [Polyangiaceae bacterium]
MRTLEFTAEGETYRAVIRQGLATIQDCHGRLVRVHRIDGGRPQPSPDDVIMGRLVSAIKGTKGGSEYLEACANVRVARDNALADPGSKWRDYEAAWLEARETVPTIRALRDSAERMRRHEVEHALKLLAKGEDPQRVLEALSHGLTNKLMHGPTAALNQADGPRRGDLAEIISQIYHLHPEE